MNAQGERRDNINLGDSLVCWNRLAEPQSDQYDSLIALAFAYKRGYARTHISHGRTFFDGKVALCNHCVSFPSNCTPAPLDHPNIERACNLIRLWPAVFTQFQLLTESVSPYINTKDFSDMSYSHDGGGFGKIAATIDDPVAFAEALVHEMAHHKLRALGVEFESAERIIRNSPEQKFRSPIRCDSLRAISAVLHAQYSFTYISALDIEIAQECKDRELARRCINSLAVNLPKLEFGYKVIRNNADVDKVGFDFLDGFFAWLNRVLTDGYKTLLGHNVSEKIFIHPLHASDDDEDMFDWLRSEDARPCRLSTVKDYSLGEDILLYLPTEEKGFALNNTAKMIWELCDGRYTIFEISQKLGQHVGCSGNDFLQSQLLQDVIETVVQLCRFRVLQLERVPRVQPTGS